MSDQQTARRIGGTAVVVVASMGGLCAARVLADRFDQVVVIDRATSCPTAPSTGGWSPRASTPTC